MRELSLHILDIATNSVEAEATRVILFIKESEKENLFQIIVRDNGRGMSPELLKKVIDPFTTSRTTRKVGMGLPLMKLSAEQAGGTLKINSELGKGTQLCVTLQKNNLNRAPLGDIGDTVVNLIIGALDVHFCYLHQTDMGCFRFDSFWIFAEMANQNLNIYEMVEPAKKYINTGLTKIKSVG